MTDQEKRPSKKNSMKENKKHPYKKKREVIVQFYSTKNKKTKGRISQFKKDIMKDARSKLKKWKQKREKWEDMS